MLVVQVLVEVKLEMGKEDIGRIPTLATLTELALQILKEEDPWKKARLGDETANKWFHGQIHSSSSSSVQIEIVVPDRPARPSNVKLVAPSLMPKLGKAGSLQSRKAIVHSLAHTESWAIDLSWDIIARFGKAEEMPKEFFDDFVKVAQDEGRHFMLLAGRLEELGSFYGALPAHDGLWDSAMATSNNLLARLAVEHCVHEARGLDVLPTTITRFRNGGDETTAALLETIIYPEEITHCAAGVKWFSYLCRRAQLRGEKETLRVSACLKPVTAYAEDSNELEDDCHSITETTPTHADGNESSHRDAKERAEVAEYDDGVSDFTIDMFHTVVRTHFRGPLKPPFNEQAREAAGFGPRWYKPLAVKDFCTQASV